MITNRLTRIAYADDHKVIRKGIVSLLNDTENIEVSIEADNGKDLLKAIERSGDLFPDVCLLDINMPVMNGFETIVELRKKWPDLGVLVLTVYNLEIYFIRMIMAGANGYLLKNCDPEELVKAIRAVDSNGMYYSDRMTRHFINALMAKDIKLPNLTENEIRVLKLSCTDLSYSEIGVQLGTTTRSVEGHRDSLFRKLKTNSRVGLAMFAVQFGLVPIDINNSGDKRVNNKSAQ